MSDADEGFTYDENPTGALRIMLRMAGYRDDEIDEELLAKAKAHYEHSTRQRMYAEHLTRDAARFAGFVERHVLPPMQGYLVTGRDGKIQIVNRPK